MCRGFQQNDSDHHLHRHQHRLLNIKAFYLRLSTNPKFPPDSLTLCFLPRINGSPLEINHSKIRPHCPAFVTLHRLLSPTATTIIIAAPAAAANNNSNNKGGSVYFGSREPVKASHGTRFEVYLREHKVLKGIFKKDGDDRWKMECSCGLEDDGQLQLQEFVKEAEVSVAAVVGGHEMAMREKVVMVVKRKTRRRSGSRGSILEEIPEETECEVDGDSCCCCSSDPSSSSSVEEEMGSSSHFHEEEEEEDTDIGLEGMSWGVDVGIWVMCLGVGLLVSKAASSTSSLRRRTRAPFF